MAKVLIFSEEPKKGREGEGKPSALGVDLLTASSWTELSGILQHRSDLDLLIMSGVKPDSRPEITKRISKIKDVPVLFLEERPASGPAAKTAGAAKPMMPPIPAPAPAAGREENGLELSRRFMDENFLAPLTLEEIAKVAGISPSYFCRRFKEVLGMSPITYLKELRVNRACHLLGHTTLPLAEITAQSGFFSIPYFCREFKKTRGLSPMQFRREMSAQNGRPLKGGEGKKKG